MKRLFLHILSALILAVVASGFTSCKDDFTSIFESNDADLTGEEVMFTTSAATAGVAVSRGDEYNGKLNSGYKTLVNDYRLKITMYEKDGTLDKPLKTCTYAPASTAADNDGTLKTAAEPGQTALYWESGTTQYAFGVTAGSDNVAQVQTDKGKWLLQDRLSGVAYAPLKTEGESGTDIDDINSLNYRTSKEWYKANRTWMPSQGIVPQDDFKKIPLFLHHERAWITVILKAGEGVDRNYLDYTTANERIATEIYCYDSDGKPFSYNGSTKTENGISPWLQEQSVEYTADVNGGDEIRSGVRYDAIVEPFDYLAKATESKISKINVSGQNFSFFASNDKNYALYKAGDPVATEAMQAYNLTAGKHLVITAVLSRESRKILLTAYVEDWTEMVTSSVCDDFGMNGDPITIQNRQQLIDFLSDDTKNKPGNVAIISATAIDLDVKKVDDVETPDPWSNYGPFDLRCTLNVGGCELRTSSQFVNNLSQSAGIINAKFAVKPGSTMETVVCHTNEGSLDYINVTADLSSHATCAGITAVNYGTITKCLSGIAVTGEDGTPFIGGIAAQSIYKSDDHTIRPIIDNCTVTGNVSVAKGVTSTYGGGIVGQASGRVSNCTYEYGVSILESRLTDGANPLLLNIVNQMCTDNGATLHAYDNQWPTIATNTIGVYEGQNKNIRNQELLYDGIVSSQAELQELVKVGSDLNVMGKKYRIARNFTITSSGSESEAWPLGFSKAEKDNSVHGNVLFFLEGGGNTITLTGDKVIDDYGAYSGCGVQVKTAPMLFNNIIGTVQNLNIYCDKPLYGIPQFNEESGVNNYTDGCAPFAYSVVGGTVRNVNVYGSSSAFVESASPGGIVVSVHDGAKMENCNSFMDVRMYLPTDEGRNADVGDGARFYAGGVAAMSETGSVEITQCRFMGTVSKRYSGNKTPLCFMGGIVGGLRRTGTTNYPILQLTDCSSWWTVNMPAGGVFGSYTQGSLIGRARYSIQVGSDTQDENGMTGCEGNWWSGNVGAGSWTKVANEAAAIGLKNSVTPTKPEQPTTR